MNKIKIKSGTGFTALKLLLLPYKQVYMVCDRNVSDYARKISTGIPTLAIDASESSKNMDKVLVICRWLLEKGADRNALVLAVGGGVTTDVVGFASSIYMRGVRYANVPTTLLGQVDAGIGGKTGVNFEGYKNMLGVIRQPEFTYIATDTLKTLPSKEFYSGVAELLKTFIIKDARRYELAVKVLSRGKDPGELKPFIAEAARIKARIVRRDEGEKGLRRVLNLGHTWGHAIEWYQQSRAGVPLHTHGEAVAIGIIQAARKSEALKIASPGLADKLAADFKAVGLPTELPCPLSELEAAMHKDKKSEDSKINYVLIRKIGDVVIKKI
jgi:3-dehydroquinate synthase